MKTLVFAGYIKPPVYYPHDKGVPTYSLYARVWSDASVEVAGGAYAEGVAPSDDTERADALEAAVRVMSANLETLARYILASTHPVDRPADVEGIVCEYEGP